MSTELTHDEQALLEGLESLFSPSAEEPAPVELTATLKQQVRDRLAPDGLSVGESLAVTLVAVVVLGIMGIHDWSPLALLASGGAVWLFARLAHRVETRPA